MQKQYRLRKNGQFRYVYRKGGRCGARLLTLSFVRGPKLLAGFAVSRKVGGAVVRNRVKRRLREAFRAQIPSLRRGLYVFTARCGAGEAEFAQLKRDMLFVLRKMNLYREVPKSDECTDQRDPGLSEADQPE